MIHNSYLQPQPLFLVSAAYWTTEYAQILKICAKLNILPSPLYVLYPFCFLVRPSFHHLGHLRQILVYHTCTISTSIPLSSQFNLQIISKSAHCLALLSLFNLHHPSPGHLWNFPHSFLLSMPLYKPFSQSRQWSFKTM